MSTWRDLPTMTSIRYDGAKIGAFPGPNGALEWWGYPPGYQPGQWEGADPQGPFATLADAKAAMSAMLIFDAN